MKTRGRDRSRQGGKRFLLLSVVLLGFALRLYALDTRSLWVDEAFSWWMSGHSVPDIVRWSLYLDQHPPGYYLLLAGWRGIFGDEVWALRAFSAFAATLTLPLAFRWGRGWGKEAGWGLLLFLAFSPLHVRYAQEARMYALFVLWVAIALAYGGGPGERMSWVGMAAVAAALWTHNLAVLFFWAFLIADFVRCNFRLPPCSRQGRLLLAALVMWGPWLPGLLYQARGVLFRFWLPFPTWRSILETFGELTLAFLPHLLTLIWPILALVFLWPQIRTRRVVSLLVLILTPLLGEIALSAIRPVYATRTFLWVLLPYGLLLGIGFHQVRSPLPRWGLAVVFLALNVLALSEYFVAYEKEPWDIATRYVAHHARPGDLLLFNAAWTQIPLDYYARRVPLPPVKEQGVPKNFYQGRTPEPLMRPEDVRRLHEFLKGHDRVWLVYSHEWYTDPHHLVLLTLKRWGHMRSKWRRTDIRIYLFTRDARSRIDARESVASHEKEKGHADPDFAPRGGG